MWIHMDIFTFYTTFLAESFFQPVQVSNGPMGKGRCPQLALPRHDSDARALVKWGSTEVTERDFLRAAIQPEVLRSFNPFLSPDCEFREI